MTSKITMQRAQDTSVPTFTTSDGTEYRGKNPEYRVMMVGKREFWYKAEKGVPFVNLSKFNKKMKEVV